MDFPTILASGWFLCCVLIFFLAIGVWLIWKLHQVFFRCFLLFFSRNAYTDDKVNQHLNKFAWSGAILVPACIFACFLWIKVVKNQQEICGITLGIWVSAVYLSVNLLLLFYAFRLLAFFSRCYQTRESNIQRPIRPIIRFFSAILVICGFIIFSAVLTKERPLIFLSTMGGAAVLFIFVFQKLISAFFANFLINTEKMLKVGDWIVIKSQGVDGLVEAISSTRLKVRNWDMSLVSLPVRLLWDETFANYQMMIDAGARRLERVLLIDQRSVRFLTGDEVTELKNLHLVTDEMMKKADAFPETDELAGEHCWTNIELFTLYAEDYLHRRPDIRHDIWCLVRAQNPTSQGLALELFCFSTRTRLAEFAPVQRAILYHLLAVLPSFRLRVFQRCSDIFQEAGDVPDKIGSAFRYDHLKNPICPSGRR